MKTLAVVYYNIMVVFCCQINKYFLVQGFLLSLLFCKTLAKLSRVSTAGTIPRN
uniref:Uncharacterized protein n=1 Tax=Anguilla anguilla TaxID=7936 RepID=A0A0E9W5Q8_ANGAN